MKKRTQIAIVLPLDIDYARRVALGVLHFAESKRWSIEHFCDNDQLMASLTKWQPVGIVGAIGDSQRLEQVLAMGLPYVDVSGRQAPDKVAQVRSDDSAVGSLAARHLLERGFTRFAYASAGARGDEDLREMAFRKQVAVITGGEISIYRDSSESNHFNAVCEPTEALRSWVTSLKRPTGVLATSDVMARQIVEACTAAEIRVPEDIAVVGCGNDEIVCRMSSPNISSVSLPAERIGHEAASLLERLMEGAPTFGEPVILPVSNVVTRQSTDVVSVPDADVAAAIRFIRAHAGEWIGVREVLLAVSINRRSLERKFRQYLGRSPLEEIRRLRMEIAKDLLSRTDLAMPIIARRAGFSEAKQLSLMFHNELNTTPTAYRRQFRVVSERQGEGEADSAE